MSKAVPEEAVVTITLSDGQELMTGDKRLTVPHLEGRARSTFGHAPLNPFMANSFAGGKGWFVSNEHETRVEWVVKGAGEVRSPHTTYRYNFACESWSLKKWLRS